MTIADLSKLSDEELNAEVAKLIGWTLVSETICKGLWTGYAPGDEGRGISVQEIPRYSSDLNAVAAVEAGLTGMGMPLFQQAAAYHSNLIDVCITTERKCLPAFATAKQRTIALIATLTP